MRNIYISIIVLLSLTGSLFATDWENPNGKPWLLSLKLFTTNIQQQTVNVGFTLPVTKWMTLKANHEKFYDYYQNYQLVENVIGNYELITQIYDTGQVWDGIQEYDTEKIYSYQLNSSQKNAFVNTIELEFHIPLYRLWGK